MRKPLEGRNILVTGAAVRVGRAVALALADAGAAVAVHYRESVVEAAEVVDRIKSLGGRAAAVRAELGDRGERASLAARATDALGGLDGLVNNASLFEQSRLPDLAPEDWHRMLDVNTCAPMILGRELARLLPDGVEGDVIHINDIHCLRPRGDYFSYTQSKALLHALTGNMALALAPRVRVNAVALGAVLPPSSPPEAYEHTAREAIPLERFPSVPDVAAAVVFLLSCRSITGETIRVDGGQHLR